MTEPKKKKAPVKKEIVKKENGGVLAKPVAGGRGFENGIDNDDLIIPRAKLLQAMSPEVVDDDMKSGVIINSLTKKDLPEIFIPIFMFKNFIRFNPRNKDDVGFSPDHEPGAIIWSTNDPLDERVQTQTKFGTNGEKPLALTIMNFFSFFPGVTMPVIVSFAKTSYKAGRQLLSLAKFSSGDMFSRKYQLESKKVQNDSGTYFVLKASSAGLVENKDEAILCEQWWTDYSVKVKDIKVHDGEGAEEKLDENGKPY